MTTYPIEVFWSDEDKVWIASAPDLPLCTAHGSTPHDAVAEIEIAIDAWLDVARAEKRSIPAPSTLAARALPCC